MKKFFKALALVLALTLVVGTIPASAAEYEFSLKKAKKIIYLGGASGEKEVDGETIKCGTKSRYKVSKLVNGFDSSTMDIQLESSDKSIVKTSNAKDKVYAKAIGTADVSIYVIDKETDKQLKDLTLKVQVKKNAAAVTAIITDADGNPVDLTATKAGVNVPYIVTLPRKDADGNFVDTDYRTLTASDESVQIEAANKYGTQYKVTFTKSGTFALTAASYQSSIWNKLQNVVTVPVTAGYDAVGAEQTALDTVKVTFDTPVVNLDKANFSAYYKISDVEIPFSDVINDGISYDSEDKNVAYVKFLSDFAAGTEYFVRYEGKEVGSFKAVSSSADAVKTVLIPTQKIDASTETALQYKLLDANGIDITKGALANGGWITFEIVNDDFKNYVTSEKVYITNANDSITVKGTYNYWDSESNQKTVVGEGQIVAVAPAVWTIGAIKGMITDGSAELVKVADYSVNGDCKEIVWTMDGTATAFLQIAVPFTKNGKTQYEGFGLATAEADLYDSYYAKVADETVALIKGYDGQKCELKANKAGSTTILIYGVKADKETVIGAVPVTVKEERKIGSWTVAAQGGKSNINLDYADDSITYEVVVKDQDGQDYKKNVAVTVEDKTSDTIKLTVDKSTSADGPKVTITIKATELAGEGTHNVKFTVNNETKTLRLVAGKDGDAKRYLIKLTKNELKTGMKTDAKNDSVEVKLEGLTAKGTAAAVATGDSLVFVGAQPKATAKADFTGTEGYVFTVTKDGKLLTELPADNVSGTTFNAFKTGLTASDAAVKLGKGTYVVNAYYVALNTAGTSYVPTPVGTAQTFTVTDDTPAAEVKKNSNAENLNAISAAEIRTAFDVSFNGTKIDDSKVTVEFNYNYDTATEAEAKTAYVKEAYVYVHNDNDLGYEKITVTVDTIVRVK